MKSVYINFWSSRWTWECTEEDVHEVDQLSLTESQCSHQRPVPWSARWQEAHIAVGDPISWETGTENTQFIFPWLFVICYLSSCFFSG